MIRIAFILAALFGCVSSGISQRIFEYRASFSEWRASRNRLPMWVTAGRYGIVPESRGGLLQAGLCSDFNPLKKIQVAYGCSGALSLARSKNKILLDELYLSMKWKKLRLDLGMLRPDEEYNGISAQNGNIILSGNARNLPGCHLRSDYIDLPLGNKLLAFKFSMADYRMIDKRFVDKTRLHYNAFYLKISPNKRMDIHIGLDHYAQWAGISPLYGRLPSSFKDYLRIQWAGTGKEGSTLSDSVNALGNHIGREHLRIDYRTEHCLLSFYHDIPFEDRSGTRFANFPDGSWGFYYGSRHSRPWVSDIMYELVYTKKQSGKAGKRKATEEEIARQDPHDPYYGWIILSGNDNYFNNGEYRSGWTYYGRMLGTPFVPPCPPDADGITLGTSDNRIIAHYLGIKGYLIKKLPYKLRLSYSFHYGTHSTPLQNTPQQFSFGIEIGILQHLQLPFRLALGLYGDRGQLYPNNFGLTLSLSRHGIIR